MFSPSTNLRLLSTPLTADYNNTLWFPNITAQTTYFLSKTVKSIDNFNYIKKDNTIVVSGDVDSYYNCNYVMYQNKNFTTKWFYAFIIRTEWAGMNQTRFYLATDVLQTWLFDITWYQSYVDRCHSDSDVAGDNIVPEDFSTNNAGGYQVATSYDMTPNGVALLATSTYAGDPKNGQMVNGLFSGAQNLSSLTLPTNAEALGTFLEAYVRNGTASAVVKIQQFPKTLESGTKTVSFAKYPTSINGYTPKNNKLLSSAFVTCFMSMYGQECTFNSAFINGKNVSITLSSDYTSGTISAFVSNYSSTDITTIAMFAVVPESTWSYNQYRNDFNLHSASNAIYTERAKQNRYINKTTSVLDSVADFAGTVSGLSNSLKLSNLVTNPVGAIAGGVSNVAGGVSSTIKSGNNAYINAKGIDEITQDLTAISESYNAPATGSAAASNGFISTGKTMFTAGYKVPPTDIAKRIDNFLTVYGYKQSTYRNINLHARASWTYIKTSGLNITGNFPQEDISTIKQIFDKGIFWWVYTATFGNFDQSNGIV